MIIVREKLFHLVHCKTLSNHSIQNLLKQDPQLKTLYKLPFKSLQYVFQLTSNRAKKFYNEFKQIQVGELLKLYESYNISFITIYDKEYPPLLKEIFNPPLVLFSMGDKSLLMRESIAAVGARNADEYASTALKILLPTLIEKGLVIVSGLAKGTDTLAHVKTIELGGRTIAVLGGGFFHLYPLENKRLAKEIADDHLLLSEYPPIWKPEKWHFPMRNRIISGISLGTVIIQAKSKSGSLITADLALEAGREVFALPGPIDHPLSEGTNDLIQQGAKLVTSGQDILDELYMD